MRRLAESAIGVAQARGFALLLARATVMRGWAMAQEGEIEDGITQMREGIAAVRRFGSNFLPGLLGCLADGHARAGQLDAALDTVTEALGTESRIGSKLFAAELHQLEGELRLQAHDATAAERSLRTAVEVARRQRALTLERRAMTSLRELLDRQGRADEARRLSDS
jgi:predicted ATPase